ncbi:hypothetical protein FB192DRAFT_1385119 [Mucor lusitanicus]|uniref:RRM Nup35-type domain-containing protein n=2 Tax=Mucor circinelloides f. lusitanicus TaxID=29924 RepID=A0A162QBC4_MUCCL|nr:hypothetical protein FB192DRAFT_1385119 [Mucor lusitanicus]OAD00500.1 hypothetical protein MUCCIDRAFT_113982 [Mucor lusitanicus CBS 277.49]
MATNLASQANQDSSAKGSLPQPPPFNAMTSFMNTNEDTSDAAAAPTSILSTIPTHKKDFASIPPAFFVGRSNDTPDVDEPVGHTRDQRNLSIGYGDRRLSGVLSEKPEETKADTTATKDEQEGSSKKRIFLSTADAQRGLFGNGIVPKKRKGTSSLQDDQSTVSNINESQSRTIRVFGYPSNLVNNVISHFNRYGKIEHFEQAPGGSWILITYQKNASALAALKSNGIVISKNQLIGVTLEETHADAVVHNVVPLNEGNGVFKTYTSNTSFESGLGKGKAGVSAMDKTNAGATSLLGYVFEKAKETIFGW